MDARNIKASDLTERVTLRSFTTADDAANNPIDTYADEATVWAEIEQGGGREFYASQQIQNESKIRVKIWWRTDVTVRWRLVWNNVTFEITDIKEIIRHRGLVLECKKVLA